MGDRNVTTVPWPLAPQSKPRSLSKTFCRTFSTLSAYSKWGAKPYPRDSYPRLRAAAEDRLEMRREAAAEERKAAGMADAAARAEAQKWARR
ncbi:hypothetical protein [Mesorhizobium sp. M0684]|uniref:hypothetical protein n=1 Tax=Mesorhizobium sp. M0684 TaxID=2956986 RepID=UPI00333C2988